MCIGDNPAWEGHWACKRMLNGGPRDSHVSNLRYITPEFFGRRHSTGTGPMYLPKVPRAALYNRDWIMVDTVNCDIRTTYSVALLLQPGVPLPILGELAGLDTRSTALRNLGKTKHEIAAIARGKAISSIDKTNKMLMALKDELEIAGRILDAYRPDLVVAAHALGKSVHSARSKACQGVEDQQIQILEEVLATMHIRVGDLIYDACLVERCDVDALEAAILKSEQQIKERLGLEAKFEVQEWPALGNFEPEEESLVTCEDDLDAGSIPINMAMENVTQIKHLVESGESLGAVVSTGLYQCITTSVTCLFPQVKQDEVKFFRDIPSYRDVFSTLPMIDSCWHPSLQSGHRYLVHMLGHCIGLDVANDYVDLWDVENTVGKRLRDGNLGRILELLKSFSPFLAMWYSEDVKSNESVQAALVDQNYNQKAGSPIKLPKDVEMQLKDEVRNVDLSSCKENDQNKWRCPHCVNHHFRSYERLRHHHRTYHKANPVAEGSDSRQTMVIDSLARYDQVRQNVFTLFRCAQQVGGNYLTRSAALLRDHVGVMNLRNCNTVRVHVLLDFNTPRFIVTGGEYIRISKNYFATIQFLLLVLSFCDFRTQSKYLRVRDRIIEHYMFHIDTFPFVNRSCAVNGSRIQGGTWHCYVS